jgi:hypothetical protein
LNYDAGIAFARGFQPSERVRDFAIGADTPGITAIKHNRLIAKRDGWGYSERAWLEGRLGQ